MESFVSKYPQQYRYAKMYLEELEEYGVDFSKDDYIYNPKVDEYRTEQYVSAGMAHLSAVYLIEEAFVGQERLEKLYGPYDFSVTRDLTEEEMKQPAWHGFIADAVCQRGGTMVTKDIYQYYKRKTSTDGNKTSGKPGLIERLKSLGFDVDAFPDDSNKIRLLYRLFFFEYDNDLKLVPFLGNPTLENVDNSFGGGSTRNGILLRKLKMPIYPKLERDFVQQVADGLISIMAHWQEQIKKIRVYVDMANIDNRMEDLDRIDSWLKGYMENIDFDKNGEYKDNILETFFLKLCQHEYLGNEYDIISVRNRRNGTIALPKYRPDECIRMAYRVIPKDMGHIKSYIIDNIDEIACFVYDREDVCENEKKEIISKIDNLKAFISILNENTQVRGSNYIKEYMIVAALAEIINPCDEKIENKFYRYTSSDQKKYSAELKNKRRHIVDSTYGDAFTKSQIAWVDKVCERFDSCLGRRKESEYQINIENNLDRLLIKILSANNLYDMMYIHNHFKIMTDTFFFPEKIISNGWKEFTDAIKIYYPEYEVTGEPYDIYQLIGICMDSGIMDQIVPEVVNLISNAKTTGRIQERVNEIELSDNYIDESNTYATVFRADPYRSELSLKMFDYCFDDTEMHILSSNGINHFE